MEENSTIAAGSEDVAGGADCENGEEGAEIIKKIKKNNGEVKNMNI